MAIPPTKKVVYNQTLPGVYGVFGAGDGLQAFYVQSAITPADLGKISLISEIPGSEKWHIRDLFQRDVDNDRITNSLLPYLERPDRIKFFNPLTLTILPMDDDGYTTLRQMPRIVENNIDDEDDFTWHALERQGFFRVRWIEDNQEFARIEWNDKRTRLVAIDGQHRLSALKRFQLDEASQGHRDFLSWRIPVVIVSFRAINNTEPPPVLTVVRSIFVYINTEARKVNRSRSILLSDESINAVCTQELVQHSHANDTSDDPKAATVPLLFYDWRGEERDGRAIDSPVSVKSVEEIHNWLGSYLLNDDFSVEQQIALKVVPSNPLNGAFVDGKLTYEYSRLARNQFGKVLLPAITHLLQNFKPYNDYIQELRRLEIEWRKEGDIGVHALSKLRFGTSLAPDPIRADVDRFAAEFVDKVADIKRVKIGELLLDDLGMRGVVSAFGSIFASMEPAKTWLAYAKWFTNALNQAFDAGWLHKDGKLAKPHLHQIAVDHNGIIINYRLDHATAALGAYVELLVLAYGDLTHWDDVDWDQIRDNATARLNSTLVRGYKKQVRLILKDQDEYRDGGKPLTEAVRKQAERRAQNHLRRLEQKLAELVL